MTVAVNKTGHQCFAPSFYNCFSWIWFQVAYCQYAVSLNPHCSLTGSNTRSIYQYNIPDEETSRNGIGLTIKNILCCISSHKVIAAGQYNQGAMPLRVPANEIP